MRHFTSVGQGQRFPRGPCCQWKHIPGCTSSPQGDVSSTVSGASLQHLEAGNLCRLRDATPIDGRITTASLRSTLTTPPTATRRTRCAVPEPSSTPQRTGGSEPTGNGTGEAVAPPEPSEQAARIARFGHSSRRVLPVPISWETRRAVQ